MSNDDVADNWEDVEESELEKRLKNIAPSTQAEPVGTGPVRLTEDTTRTVYQPQVKILKRNPDGLPGAGDMAAASSRAAACKPLKTLQEREAAYAEARLRIMGSADSGSASEPAQESRPARLTEQLETMKVTENVIRQPSGPDGTKGFMSDRQEK
ncbi:SUZ domain-containing protein 1 [Lamellibrachia satsuma]|nr:SUZ domain-containing protein 1 [Lamellibrachia satsuma]